MAQQITYTEIHMLLQVLLARPYQLNLHDPNSRFILNANPRLAYANNKAPVAKVLVCLGQLPPPGSEHGPLEQYQVVLLFHNKAYQEQGTGHAMTSFRTINNRGGTLRWLYLATDATPGFLNFYYQGSWRSKCIACAYRAAHTLGLGGAVANGYLTVMHHQPLPVASQATMLGATGYSLFMGTPGQHHKLLVEFHAGKKATYFTKVATSRAGKKQVDREQMAYWHLRQFNLKYTRLPQFHQQGNGHWVTFANVKGATARRQQQLTPAHFNAIKELANQTHQKMSLAQSTFFKALKKRIDGLKVDGKVKDGALCLANLHKAMDGIDASQQVSFAFAHGDFTPWNLYAQGDGLAVYDLEMARLQAPVLYDVFHFIFQTGVLVNRQGFEEIWHWASHQLQQQPWLPLLLAYQVDLRLHLLLYVLDTASHYLAQYAQQQHLHQQAQWLVQAWCAAVNTLAYAGQPGLPQRAQFIDDFVAFTNHHQVAWLKWLGGAPNQLPTSSDIDMAVQHRHLPALVQFCQKHPLVQNCKLWRQSFMVTLQLCFHDGTCLSIDLLHALARKSLLLMPFTELLKSTATNQQGMAVPHITHDFEYLWLFYTANHQPIPDKYQQWFLSKPAIVQNGIKNYMCRRYDLQVPTLTKMMHYTPGMRRWLFSRVIDTTYNNPIRRLHRGARYLAHAGKKLLVQYGFTITLSGVDGAGKTTIINQLTQALAQQYRRPVKVLRHRPSVLPIISRLLGKKQPAAAYQMPHSGSNNSQAASLLRFAYYLFDYCVGQFYVALKYHTRGYIVVYDRYYFDFISDMRRSNLRLPQWVARCGYRLLLKPKVNVYLFAPSHIIRARKKELSPLAIDALQANYKALFKGLARKSKKATYKTIENIDQQATLRAIMHTVRTAI